jgi:ribose 5-phosphate isomerase RpiB
MRIGIATDHGGFSLQEGLVTGLRAGGHEVVDFGANLTSTLPVPFPMMASWTCTKW